jgi:ATP-dependent RNA helicase SUPV3L1/SUV3
LIDSLDSRVLSYKGSVKQSNVGLVTCLDENHLDDIQTALNSEPEPIKAAGLLPPVQFIDAFANSLPPGTPFEYLLQRLNEKAVINPRYFMCNIRDQASAATCIDKVKGLSVVQSCILSAAPADTRTDIGKGVIQALARCIASRAAVTVVDVPEIPLDALDRPLSGDREYLLQLELLHKSLVLYLWLAYRFSNIFLDREMATHAKEMVEEKINRTLLQFSANPKLRKKLLLMRHAIGDKVASGDSRDKFEDEVPERSESGPVEEELTESLNDLTSLPVDWENRPPSGDLDTDAAALGIHQPSTAHP